jgi:DNA modification methylase/ParB-like chromosome segregation protein Spo0J
MTIDVGKVAMVPVDSIYVSERARQEMGDLDGLEKSLKQSGLAQPLAVMENEVGSYLLLAGERRYTVLRRNNIPLIPVRIYPPSISEMERKAIELAENFWRKDFEYHEHDALVKQIHELQIEIHGQRISTAPDAPGWSQEKTAELMGISRPVVNVALKRAEAREAIPEIFAGCKTQKDATKVLDKLNEALIKEALAKKLETDLPTGSILKRLSDAYILQDFFTGVSNIPDGSIHMVEIDPPYGIALEGLKKQEGSIASTDMQHYNEIPACDYTEFMQQVLNECYRVMTEHSWLICWFGPDPWFEPMYQMITKAGFKTNRLCGIWVKGGAGQSMNPTIRLANNYEMFFYASKGTPALAKPGASNVFAHAPVPSQRKLHPTERPIELMQDIYSTFTWAGARMLIPFLGSGSGLIAAHTLNISAFGFELSSEYRDSYLLRINSQCGLM